MKRFFCILSYISLSLIYSSFAFAQDTATIVAKANKLYQSGKFDEALTLYNQALKNEPDSPLISFNIGTAQFKKKNYAIAISSFEKATLAKDKALEAKANYNIGNAKYKLGKLKENTSLSETVKLLREALDYYKRAFELNDKDKEAKVNHELVEKELKALLDKLKQQKDSKGQGQKQDGEEGGSQEKEGARGKSQEKQANENQQKSVEEKKEEPQGEEKKQEAASPQKEKIRDRETQNEAYKPEEAKEMSEEEALMLLEGYRYEENTKGQIKDTRKGYLGKVDKDW